MKDINLLPPKDVLSQQERKARRILLIVTSILVGLALVSTGALLGFGFYLDSQLTSQQLINSDLKTQLASRQKEAETLRTVQYKLEGIDTLVRAQIDFGERLERAFALAPFPIEVESMDWTNGSKLIMVLNFPSRIEAEAFLKLAGEETNLPYFQNIKVGSLNQGSGNSFALTMEAGYVANVADAEEEFIPDEELNLVTPTPTLIPTPLPDETN